MRAAALFFRALGRIARYAAQGVPCPCGANNSYPVEMGSACRLCGEPLRFGR